MILSSTPGCIQSRSSFLNLVSAPNLTVGMMSSMSLPCLYVLSDGPSCLGSRLQSFEWLLTCVCGVRPLPWTLKPLDPFLRKDPLSSASFPGPHSSEHIWGSSPTSHLLSLPPPCLLYLSSRAFAEGFSFNCVFPTFSLSFLGSHNISCFQHFNVRSLDSKIPHYTGRLGGSVC